MWQTISLSPVIDEHGINRLQDPSPGGDFELQGQVVSAGSGRGTAWFPERRAKETPVSGVVLVSATLPPHFVAYFSSVQAVVVDQSAWLSHGAILARQFGIPVVSHPEATRIIRDHDLLHVNGNTGRIHIVRSPA